MRQNQKWKTRPFGLLEKVLENKMENNFENEINRFDSDLITLYRSNQYDEVERRLQALKILAADNDEKDYALAMFVNHMHFIGDITRARQALFERINLSPESTSAWIGLTEHYHYHDIDLENALRASETALEKAFLEKRQVRQILGVRIRIALARKDYKLVLQSLSELVSYQLPLGGFDVAFESDFIDQIPVDTVPAALINQYKILFDSKH